MLRRLGAGRAIARRFVIGGSVSIGHWGRPTLGAFHARDNPTMVPVKTGTVWSGAVRCGLPADLTIASDQCSAKAFEVRFMWPPESTAMTLKVTAPDDPPVLSVMIALYVLVADLTIGTLQVALPGW